MARVLVGIPTKNRPEFVKEAVASVLAQTFDDFRVVVSDNRSAPEVSAEVERFVRELADPRVSYYLQPVDDGEYGQGRYLFSECSEEYLIFLHDDDRLEPTLLKTAIAALEADPVLAFFSCSQYVFDAAGDLDPEMTQSYTKNQGRDQYPEGRMQDLLEPLFKFGLFSISGTLFRASALRESGLVDPDLGGNYPFEFNVFLRIAERRMLAYYSPERLVGYRWHDMSLQNLEQTGFNEKMIGSFIRVVERRRFEGAIERSRRRILGLNCRNYAFVRYVANDRRDCYRYLGRALRLQPMSWRVWAYCAFAIFFPWLIRRFWGSRVIIA